MPVNYAALEAEHLALLKGGPFEILCGRLLTFEAELRHPVYEFDPGEKQYTPDRGVDGLLVVRSDAPNEPRRFPHLTHDAKGSTVFSCKTGEAWLKGVLRDLKRGLKPRKKGKGKSTPPKNVCLPTIQILADGGRFTVLTNAQLGSERLAPCKDKVVSALEARFKTEGRDVPDDLADRVAIFEAGRIAAFIRQFGPQLPPEILAALPLTSLGHTRRFAAWTSYMEGDRGLPAYVPDRLRTTVMSQLGDLLLAAAQDGGPPARAVWLHGHPGTGKSRLVQEAIAKHPGQTHRVLVAMGDAEIANTLRSLQESPAGDLVLVLDECDPIRARAYANDLLSHHHFGSGRLIMIGPSPAPDDEPRQLAGLEVVPLAPLDQAASLELIHQQLTHTGDEKRVDRIWTLAEGYPWFTILLAQALKDPRSPLPLDKDHKAAAKLAIGGAPIDFPSSPAWEQETTRRTRALFATLLTEGHEDLNELPPTEQNALCHAVRLPTFDELVTCLEACWRRGILRRAPDLRWQLMYVTPANLERLAAELYLSEPYNREQLRRHVPHRLDTLRKRLKRVGVRDSVVATFASDDMNDLEGEDGESAVESITRAGPNLLTHLAYYHPRRMASWLRRWLVGLTHTQRVELPANVRRRVMWSLQHLTHRQGTLLDAEVALFLLALAETEVYGNNATALWTGLFHLGFNTTHASLTEREELLHTRCTDNAPPTRMLALDGLKTMIARGAVGPAWSHDDQIDGDWLQPTPQERTAGLQWAWQQLLTLSDDLDPDVRHKARHLIANLLRTQRVGPFAAGYVQRLAERVGDWQEDERILLRGALDQWMHYDLPPESPAPLHDAIQALYQALAPRTYHDRLVDAVAQFRIQLEHSRPGGAPSEQEELDRLLARDGLSGDQPLLREVVWLDSDAARRASTFLRQVGEIDEQLALLPALMQRGREGGAARLVPAYLSGVVTAQGLAPFDALHETWCDDPHLMELWLGGLMLFGASPHHAPWIVAALESDVISPERFGRMAWRPWSSALDDETVSPILQILAGDESFSARFAAMDLIRERADSDPDRVRRHADTLLELVRHLARSPLGITAAWRWSQAARILLQWGRAEAVADAAMIVIESIEQADTTHGWDLWTEAAKLAPEAAWSRLGEVLLRPDRVGAHAFVWSSRQAFADLVPPNVVLDWIDGDRSRAWRAAMMSSAHEVPLNELARQLLIRWGADGRPADELSTRAHSTPGTVHSFAHFYTEQLQRAQQWAQDPEPAVAAWGRQMVESFRRRAEAERAREAFERRVEG